MESTPPPPYGVLPSYDQYLKFLDFPNFWLRITLDFFVSKKCSVHPFTAFLGHPVQIWEPLGPTYRQKEEKWKFPKIPRFWVRHFLKRSSFEAL